MRKFVLLILIIFTIQSYSQSNKEWFPKGLNIQPFTANFLEPKAGFNYLLGESNIRLDIGTSADILKIVDEDKIISYGVDLFTYTRLRSDDNFKFPVETIDFYFGVNYAQRFIKKEKEYGFRFRFAHISTHLVDGSFDQQTNTWRNGRVPIVYSREFFELMPFYRVNGFRAYVGLTYLFHTLPDKISKGIYQIGFDNYFTSFSANAFTPFVAYDFKLSKIDKFTGNNIFSTGLKFGKFDKKGFSITISYYSGKSVHGQLFDINENYFTFGFNMDL
ncbi:MAG: DUF1207 domain-containing protein [Bacteroidetes bacterium]|nr:DUF1207 domain-containing protein [Bacteroidota bacterium]MCH8326594.1 DUF1207 domain-containing protein [Bacteroidota bacterium]